MFFAGLPPALPHIKAGKLVALAVTTATRWPALPDVPTMAEASIPGFNIENWQGIFVPASTSADVVNRLARDIATVAGREEGVERLREQGAAPRGDVAGASSQSSCAPRTSSTVVWSRNSGSKVGMKHRKPGAGRRRLQRGESADPDRRVVVVGLASLVRGGGRSRLERRRFRPSPSAAGGSHFRPAARATVVGRPFRRCSPNRPVSRWSSTTAAAREGSIGADVGREVIGRWLPAADRHRRHACDQSGALSASSPTTPQRAFTPLGRWASAPVAVVVQRRRAAYGPALPS